MAVTKVGVAVFQTGVVGDTRRGRVRGQQKRTGVPETLRRCAWGEWGS